MRRRNILSAALISCALVVAPVAANATEEPEPAYVLAAWTINTPGFDGDTVTDVWGGGGQTLAFALPTDSADLTQLNTGYLACGAWYQIDLYANDATTNTLLVGGHLYGPSNPQESPANVNPWYVSYWYSGDCTPKPEVRPYAVSGETFSCDGWNTWAAEGFYDVTFNPVTNAWTENTSPTIKSQTEGTRATTYEERQASGCNPELAETGLTPFASQMLIGGLLLLVIGASLVAYRVSRKEG